MHTFEANLIFLAFSGLLDSKLSPMALDPLDLSLWDGALSSYSSWAVQTWAHLVPFSNLPQIQASYKDSLGRAHPVCAQLLRTEEMEPIHPGALGHSSLSGLQLAWARMDFSLGRTVIGQLPLGEQGISRHGLFTSPEGKSMRCQAGHGSTHHGGGTDLFFNI